MSSDRFLRAFPESVAADVRGALDVMPGPMRTPEGRPMAPVGEFTVLAAGEKVTIPYRIYNRIPQLGDVEALSGAARVVLHCLFTRHHDGYQRQRSVREVLGVADAWVVPYVVQLIGEYVLEIHQTIHEALYDLAATDDRATAYGEFITANPEFMELTRQRTISYWNCYYRQQYPNRERYPAVELIRKLAHLQR